MKERRELDAPGAGNSRGCAQAAFESELGSGSGADPHTYMLKAGGVSSREPREITIPRGSSATRLRFVSAI